MQDVLSQIRASQEQRLEHGRQVLHLMPVTSDPASQKNLLAIARRFLSDGEVFKTWVSLLGMELDSSIKQDILVVAASAVRAGRAPADWAKHVKDQFANLASALADAATRPPALSLVATLISADPSSALLVKDLLPVLQTDLDREELLRSLFEIRFTWMDAPDFFAEVDQRYPQAASNDWRESLISYLLDENRLSSRRQVELLTTSGVESIRLAILNHWIQRFQQANSEFVSAAESLLKTEPSPRLRISLLNYLALCIDYNPELAQIFIHRLSITQDPAEAEYLELILTDLVTAPEWGEKTVDALMDLFISAKNAAVSHRVFRLVTPLMTLPGAANRRVIAKLLEFLKANANADLTRELIKRLSLAAASTPDIAQSLCEEAEIISDDRVKADILNLLVSLPGLPNVLQNRVDQLAKTARTSVSPFLRESGLNHLIYLRLTPETGPQFAGGIPLLNDDAIDTNLRIHFANKLARCPHLPAAASESLRAEIIRMPAEGLFGQARAHLNANLATLTNSALNADEPNWDEWLDRIQNSKAIDGMVPAVYTQFSKNSQRALAVLKSMLFQNDYSWPSLVRPKNLLEFLIANDAIDDEITNYALEFLLTKDDSWGDMDFHLMILKNSPHPEALAERCWLVFERQGNLDRLNPALLREVLALVHGSEVSLAHQFATRLRAVKSATDLDPYLKFLRKNLAWPHSREVVASLEEVFAANPQLEENGNRDQVNLLRLDLDLDQLRPGLVPEKTKQAGLLDD